MIRASRTKRQGLPGVAQVTVGLGAVHGRLHGPRVAGRDLLVGDGRAAVVEGLLVGKSAARPSSAAGDSPRWARGRACRPLSSMSARRAGASSPQSFDASRVWTSLGWTCSQKGQTATLPTARVLALARLHPRGLARWCALVNDDRTTCPLRGQHRFGNSVLGLPCAGCGCRRSERPVKREASPHSWQGRVTAQR